MHATSWVSMMWARGRWALTQHWQNVWSSWCTSTYNSRLGCSSEHSYTITDRCNLSADYRQRIIMRFGSMWADTKLYLSGVICIVYCSRVTCLDLSIVSCRVMNLPRWINLLMSHSTSWWRQWQHKTNCTIWHSPAMQQWFCFLPRHTMPGKKQISH